MLFLLKDTLVTATLLFLLSEEPLLAFEESEALFSLAALLLLVAFDEASVGEVLTVAVVVPCVAVVLTESFVASDGVAVETEILSFLFFS